MKLTRRLIIICLAYLAISPVAAQPRSKEILEAADFEFIGVLKVPEVVSGYGWGALAVRNVDGRPSFFITGHRHESDPVFEIAGDFTRDFDKAERASLVRAWGDVYRGRKLISNNENQAWTEDLEWFNGRLFWTYGDSYNVTGGSNAFLGATTLPADAEGPWRSSLHSHMTQGYITTVPQWYADRYLDGRRFAVGSGLRSGNIASSWGPNLTAIPVPARGASATSVLRDLALVQYDYDRRLARENTYTALSQPPDRPGGWWTQQDWINGAVWIDLPDTHGVVFFGALGAGRVWYGGPTPSGGIKDVCADWQGPHAERYDLRWWIYDPMSFVPVAGGKPWEIKPRSVFDPHKLGPIQRNCLGQMTGAAFDPGTRMLYVVGLEAEPLVESGLPVIHAFRIRS